MSDGTCSIPGEVLLYPSIPGEVLLYPSIKPPPPGVPVNALAATQILLDLIAELRERQDRLRRKSGYPSELVQDYDFAMGDIADRAAARLGKESP